MSLYRNRFERDKQLPFAKLIYLLPLAAFLALFLLFTAACSLFPIPLWKSSGKVWRQH